MVFKLAFRSLIPLLACAVPLMANGEIYTWKDANGRTHFADQAPVGTDAKPVRGNIVPADTDQARNTPAPGSSASAPKDAKASGPKSWEEQDRDFKQRRAEQSEAETKAKKDKEAKAEKDKYCSSLRSNLAMLERGGRFSKPDTNGERNYLSEGQVKSEADDIRNRIAKDCK
ncbi:MAG: hypothetical protein H6R19_1793 [Proteobacteria bacterium]|nr:hypothetical protein [Pseudomonadota bacterium]